MHKLMPGFLCFLVAAWLSAISIKLSQAATTATAQSHFKPLAFKIIKTQAHNPKAFTQGWLIDGDTFYESSGLYRQSYVVRYNRQNNIEQKYTVPNHLFAEGLTLFKKELYLLSWQAGLVLVLNPSSLKAKRSYRYKGQGWGLTHNNTHLIMSNGSNTLQLRNPKTFKKTHSIAVHGGGHNWQRLNELEYAKDLIWANIWQTGLIAAIDPATGQVAGTLNLTQLVKANTQNPDYQSLNGIAYDAKYDAFWITGKEWSKRYLIDIHLQSDMDKPLQQPINNPTIDSHQASSQYLPAAIKPKL